MAEVSNRDRTPQLLELTKTPWPAPPLNLFMLDGTRGVIDLRWDDPAYLTLNSRFQLLRVNLYRSFDSEFGPYKRITELPVGSTFWRDQTDNELVGEEDVTNQFLLFGEASTGQSGPRYVFRTLHYPLVGEGSRGRTTNLIEEVRVYVDGVEARVKSVSGPTGEVEIDPGTYPNVGTQKWMTPVVPTSSSRVTCTYRYTRDFLKTDLSQRIFYRVTTVGIPADCSWRGATPEDLVETPLEHAAATNTFEIEKLDYIWRESIRRNRWILEQGGERVRVFLRKNVGVPCLCVSEIHKQPISDCHTCFKPGTLVRSERGWRAIETIQVGEKVLSSDGKYHRVSKTFETHFEGELISILSSVSTQPILATPNHPFLALRGSHKEPGKCNPSSCRNYIEGGDGLTIASSKVRLLPSGRWWARAQVGGSRGKGRKALGTYSTQEQAEEAVRNYKRVHLQPGHSLSWVEARSLVRKDWLVSRWSDEVSDIDSISIPKQYLKNTKYGPTRQGETKFVVDEEFLWVVGMYLAEGSTGSRTVSFSLHLKEKTFQDRIRSFFHSYGYKTSLGRLHGNGVCVLVNSTTLAQWLPVFLGHLCYNKNIPEVLMHLPKSKTWALIQGIYDGDGWKGGNEITQTSEILALQITELLHQVGEKPLVRRQISKKRTPKGNLRRVAYTVSWAEDTHLNENRKMRWICKGNLLARVRSIGKVPYSGPVYNLSVEEDETYITNGVAVHNCYGTGIVGGYEGPYDLIVAPDDADVKISQRDLGRTTEHTYEVWTGPQPLLSHRDFILKINGDRYSIGPVRMPSNRGNLLQQHFSISSFDDKDIRYQVSIGNPVKYSAVQYSSGGPEFEASDQITDSPNIGDERELRGRTLAWKNIQY